MAKALAKAKKAAKKKPVKKKAAKKVAVKKVATKPVKVTTKSIEAQLAKKGYTVNIDDTGRTEYEIRRVSDGYCGNRLYMRIDGLPYCCGVDEIGDVECEGDKIRLEVC